MHILPPPNGPYLPTLPTVPTLPHFRHIADAHCSSATHVMNSRSWLPFPWATRSKNSPNGFGSTHGADKSGYAPAPRSCTRNSSHVSCSFSEQSIIRLHSFDGRIISAIANYPKAATPTPSNQQPSRYPELICIHGGPEAQASCGFLGRLNYFVAEMGFANLQPSV